MPYKRWEGRFGEKRGAHLARGGCTAVGSSSLFFEIQPSGLPPPIEEEEEERHYIVRRISRKRGVIFPSYSKEKENSGFFGKGGYATVSHTKRAGNFFPIFNIFSAGGRVGKGGESLGNLGIEAPLLLFPPPPSPRFINFDSSPDPPFPPSLRNRRFFISFSYLRFWARKGEKDREALPPPYLPLPVFADFSLRAPPSSPSSSVLFESKFLWLSPSRPKGGSPSSVD